MAKIIPMNRASMRGLGEASDEMTLGIAIGGKNRGVVDSKTQTWLEIRQKMADCRVDTITCAEYDALNKTAQGELKQGRFFVGGTFTGKHRSIREVASRSMLTLDLDECSQGLLADIVDMEWNWLNEYEFFLYTTRSHRASAPRVRIVIPLAHDINEEHLNPVTRIVASYVDPTMLAVDKISFRSNQFMFYPSRNSDGEFICHHNKGKMLNAQRLLDSFGDWTDYRKLPRSPRELKNARSARTMQDPREKHGIVGAFCRSYTVVEAIAEFLSDIYVPSDSSDPAQLRYTYAPGSTTNGVVVYDDEKFLQVFQGSSPISDRLVNSFDLVAIHKFGHLDPPDTLDNDEDLDVAKPDAKSLPSYKAMKEWLKDDPAVQRELLEDNYDLEAIANDFKTYDDDEPVVNELHQRILAPAEVASLVPENWEDLLERSENGIIKNKMPNVKLILQYDPRLRGCLAFNEFLNEPVVIRSIVAKSLGIDSGLIRDMENGDAITDAMVNSVRFILESARGEGKAGWGMDNISAHIEPAISLIVDKHRFHPIRNYLHACKWDGVPRISGLFVDYCHAEDTALNREIARLMMVGAVARVMEPGSKFDFVVILRGEQGIRKSTFLQTMAGSYKRFGELSADPEKRDKVVENISGWWIVEIPELSTFDKTESAQLKALFSAQFDKLRPAFARRNVLFPRQCIFAGTTNERTFFKDTTGNRRFWPVEVGDQPIDIDGLQANVELMWGEALNEYYRLREAYSDMSRPLPLYLKDEAAKQAVIVQEARQIETPESILADEIAAWADTPVTEARACPMWREGMLGDDGSEPDPDLEPLVQRTMICHADVHYYVRKIKEDGRISTQDTRLVTQAMKLLPGWSAKTESRKTAITGRSTSIKVFLRRGR